MATLPYKSIVSSKLFTIVVGPEKKTYSIHAALLAALSKPLDVLVNGGMKEAIEATAEWPDVDEETFVRVCEFAYTGNYNSPDHRSVSTRTNHGSSLKHPEVSSNFIFGSGTPGITSNSPSSTVNGAKKSNTGTEASIRGKFWAKITIENAKIYVFADCYLVSHLANLSLKKLRAILSDVPKDKIGGEVLGELAKYSYSNTVDKGFRRDPLRELVSDFIAKHVETLWSSTSIQSAMESHGELSKDVIGQLIPRLQRNASSFTTQLNTTSQGRDYGLGSTSYGRGSTAYGLGSTAYGLDSNAYGLFD
ncbi:hypothetical protein GGR57DRAFT_470527 [Xylariaceae sp. FL1272]|nr:hypothetical protein GGR57DRAFT_470527 [Xylariaceae sp. FL1272]